MSNYDLQQYFLNMVKDFSISNPGRPIDRMFVYSLLEQFNIRDDQYPLLDISENFEYWQNRYENVRGINVFEYQNRPFLWFESGRIEGNEIKLYVPLDPSHLKYGVDQLFDFITNEKIVHQSKVAKVIRTDNVVIRVTTLEDADKILKFVANNQYLQEGLLKVNPFLPNYNGIGATMDNFTTYNGTVAQIISDYLNYCKANNNMEQFNIEGLNNYIKNCIPDIEDLDVKDIYSLLSKVTTPTFKFQDFAEHARYKIPDKYDDEYRITDPTFYFEQAVRVTNRTNPQNTKLAILEYLKNNPNYFSAENKAKSGLIKYVKPGDVINIMRSKLSEKGIEIPRTDNELIDQYLQVLLNLNAINNVDIYEIVKNAYLATEKKYGERQAHVAVLQLLNEGETKYFTNDGKVRDAVKRILNFNIKKEILKRINIENLDINNNSEIVTRFENIIKPQTYSNQKV